MTSSSVNNNQQIHLSQTIEDIENMEKFIEFTETGDVSDMRKIYTDDISKNLACAIEKDLIGFVWCVLPESTFKKYNDRLKLLFLGKCAMSNLPVFEIVKSGVSIGSITKNEKVYVCVYSNNVAVPFA